MPGAALAVCSRRPPLLVGDPVTLACTLLKVVTKAAEVGSVSSVCRALEAATGFDVAVALVGVGSCSSLLSDMADEGAED
jgi:hypothetical protein